MIGLVVVAVSLYCSILDGESEIHLSNQSITNYHDDIYLINLCIIIEMQSIHPIYIYIYI